MNGAAHPFPTMKQQLNTILAALRFYQQHGQGDPARRSDAIHDIATDGEIEISLDDAGIDELCQALNFGEILLEKPAADRSRHTLTALAAAMHPGGPERLRLLETVGGPDPDDFDADGALRDGDLYRISSDDSELAHWRNIAEEGLAPVAPTAHVAEAVKMLEDLLDDDDARVSDTVGEVVQEVISILGGAPAVQLPTPFTGEELTMIFEFAREGMTGYASVFEAIGVKMDVADEDLSRVRDKLQAVMDSDMPLFGVPHVVVELIEQRPSVSVHPTEKAALDHAVQCAMENLHNPDHDKEESRFSFAETLKQYDHIREGDYEIHITTPTN
jgi:hypothetical protein